MKASHCQRSCCRVVPPNAVHPRLLPPCYTYQVSYEDSRLAFSRLYTSSFFFIDSRAACGGKKTAQGGLQRGLLARVAHVLLCSWMEPSSMQAARRACFDS